MKSFVDSMHVLGLEDRPNGDQNLVYEEFKEQLVRSPEEWYETLKGNHPPLPNSMHLKRLDHFMRKLEKQPRMLQKYNDIIQDQLMQGARCKSGRQQSALRSASSMMNLPKAVNQHRPLVSVQRQAHPCRISLGVYSLGTDSISWL